MSIRAKRVSHNVGRVAAILETLRAAKRPVSVAFVHQAINDLLPKPVGKRTIARDLESLAVVGFVEVDRRQTKANDCFYYQPATPSALRKSIQATDAAGIK